MQMASHPATPLTNDQDNDQNTQIKASFGHNSCSSSSPVISRPSPSPIEKLPLELKLFIFQTLYNPRDVYSLIRASPILYQAFQNNKSNILAAAISRVILPENRPLALLVCEAQSELSARALCQKDRETVRKRRVERREIKSSSKRGCDSIDDYRRLPDELTYRDLRTARLSSFLSKYSNHGGIWKANINLHDELVAMKLCRLWDFIDHFVYDYVRFARIKSKLNSEYSEDKATNSSKRMIVPNELSFAEYGRLQRAFFRFELSRHVFGGSDRYAKSLDAFYDIDMNLGYCMTRFQKFEFLSISEYLVSCMESYFDEIEDYAVTKIRIAASLTSKVNNESRNRENSENGIQGEEVTFHSGHFKCLPFFRKKFKGSQKSYMLDILEVGLPFFKHFSQMSRAKQLRVVNNYAWSSKKSWTVPFGPYALYPSTDHASHAECQNLGETITGPSAGYEYIQSSAVSQITALSKYNLSQCGFDFWDHVNAPDFTDPFGRDIHNSSNLRRRRDRYKDPSVEERLHGTKITCYNLEEALSPSLSGKDIVDLFESCGY